MPSRRALLAGAVTLPALTRPTAGRGAGGKRRRDRLQSQPAPTTEWTATYRPASGRALVGGLCPAGDDGHWLAGTRFAGGSGEAVWALPVTADGRVGEPSVTDRYERPLVAGAAPTTEGGVVVLGNGLGGEPLAIRYGPAGARRWATRLAPGDGGRYAVTDAVPAGDGHVLVGRHTPAGTTRADVGWVARLGPDGGLSRSRTVEGPGERLRLRAATPTGDGVFAVGQAVTGDEVAWLGVLGPDGGVRWGRTLATLDGLEVLGATACAPLGDGYVVGAYGGSSVSEAQPYVVGLGPEGAVRWRVFAPGPGAPRSVVPTDRGVFAVGDSPLQTTDVLSWATWTTGDGRRLWRTTDGEDRSTALAAAAGEGVVVAGRRGRAALLGRRSLPASAATTGSGDDAGADGTATGSDAEDAGGDGGGGLPAPGFGPGAALVGGALGLAELLRRRR